MKAYYETEGGQLFNIDCVEFMRTLPDNYIDLIITSPPYDNLRSYKRCEWNFDIFKAIACELFRVTKTGGVVVWVVGDATINGSETGTSFRQALYFKEVGFNLHDTMMYVKRNYVPLTHNRYEQAFEYMFVFSKGKPKTFNPILIKCKQPGKIEKYGLERRQNYGKNHSMRLYPTIEFKPTKDTKIASNIFKYILGQDKNGHPAQFPEKLAADHMISWSNEDDLIFDPFMGSGTVGKQAELLKRRWLGCEIAKEYCEIIKKRITPVANQISF